MCLTNCQCQLNNENNDNWNYEDQEQWKLFQNYYSVQRTPFNIKDDKIIDGCDDLKICYKTKVNGIYNNSHTTPFFNVEGENNYVLNKGKKFILRNFHIHNSSEHTIDDQYFNAEMHFVNEYVEPNTNISYILVIGLLLEITKKNGLKIWNIDYKKIKNDETYSSTVDLSIFNKLAYCPYYKFIGTLTVPPFSQNFNWNLWKPSDVEKFKLALNEDDYNRFVYYFANNKDNQLTNYNKSRYINNKNNFLAVKKINNNCKCC